MTKQEVAKLVGEFYVDNGYYYYIVTDSINFVWRCPFKSGLGHNTISVANRSLGEWSRTYYIRNLGKHIIGEFCGEFRFNEKPARQ